MMKACEFCEKWAQWRMYWVEPQPVKKEMATIYSSDNTPVEKPLVPRGPKLTPGPVVCCEHKEEMEKQPSELERRFVFAGAIRA